MGRLIWGFVALVSFTCLCVGYTVTRHIAFEGPKVVHETEKRYAIQGSSVQLLSDATEVVLLVSDRQKPRNFLKFRPDELQKRSIVLSIPRDGHFALASRLRRMGTPDDVESPKADTEETVRIYLTFEPIDKRLSDDGTTVPRRSMVDGMWLYYEGFPPLQLVRTNPVDNQITAFFVEEISPGKGILLGLVGLFGTIFVPMLAFGTNHSARLELPESDRNSKSHAQQEETSVDAKNAVPRAWEADVITNGFRRFVTKPKLLDIYVREITKRFIIGQDDRTAKKRIDFLKTKIEELRLTKDLESCLDDLSLRDINLRIAQLELEIKEASLEEKRRRQTELSELEHQRDTMKMKVEIARSEKEIRDLKTPASKPQKEKGRTKKDVEAEINKANVDTQRIDSDSKMPEDEKMKRRNMIARRKDALLEELEQFK
jgi:hypothetical protein